MLIISYTPHYKLGEYFYGWEPTVREIDYLSSLFEEVIHIAPLYKRLPKYNIISYSSKKVRVIPVNPAGGDLWREKVNIVKQVPNYVLTIYKEISNVDVIHIRCPANISLIAIVLLSVLRYPKYRWAKYAGNWKPKGKEVFSYTFQRWWLNKGFHRGVVTVNGIWKNQPKYVYSFFNPCLTQEEVEFACTIAYNKELIPPYNLLFVGRVESVKGVGRFLKIIKELHKQGIHFKADIVGDGPEREKFEVWVKENGLSSVVTFHGWKPKSSLAKFYSCAHFLIFPSSSEGWPKVLSEAMAYGAVSIAGAISSIPQILSKTGAGLSFPPHDINSFVNAILDYIHNPQRWRLASQAGVAVASLFTYEYYLEAVRKMFWDAWGIRL